jgi:hydrogenase expression/formation protein HypE
MTVTDRILLTHGSGGKTAHRLIEEVFLAAFDNPMLAAMEDSATAEFSGRLAFTTDGFVVHPIFFPGGDIGKLAVCGTVNDLAMAGAEPLYLSLGLIIEEGLPVADLRRVVESVAATAREAGVSIVTGDTKVVHRGKADALFITTAGVGRVRDGVTISSAAAKPGDRILINGTIGDHGIAVVSQREGLTFGGDVKTDCAPLGGLVADMLAVCPDIRCLRDPTRGGVATTLNEIADRSAVGIRLEEGALPVTPVVAGACEMLGFDPLYVANEGKVLAVVPGDAADAVLTAMRAHRYGADAAIIGEVTATDPGRVTLRTQLGTTRIVEILTGDLLPRIC